MPARTQKTPIVGRSDPPTTTWVRNRGALHVTPAAFATVTLTIGAPVVADHAEAYPRKGWEADLAATSRATRMRHVNDEQRETARG
jgi:hypothetical protein